MDYKKRIGEDLNNKNFTTFCKEMMLDFRMVRKLRAVYDYLSRHVDEGNAKKCKCRSGRQPLFSGVENITAGWIVDRRRLVVRRADIQEFALAMAPPMDINSQRYSKPRLIGWIYSFGDMRSP